MKKLILTTFTLITVLCFDSFGQSHHNLMMAKATVQ